MHAKDPGYHAQLTAALLDAIPRDAALVLDIGCGTGGLGAAHKARNPDAWVAGIEPNAATAAEAARALDMVLCCAVEAADLDFLDGKVDCIVYGDTLNRLRDPWSVLAGHRALLRETGVVVASIPNVQHWSLIEHLLLGYWTYSDSGLLDAQHLRFFTFQSTVGLFERAGLRIDRTLGLFASPEQAAAAAEMLAPALAALEIERAGFEATISPLQYLITATRR